MFNNRCRNHCRNNRGCCGRGQRNNDWFINPNQQFIFPTRRCNKRRCDECERFMSEDRIREEEPCLEAVLERGCGCECECDCDCRRHEDIEEIIAGIEEIRRGLDDACRGLRELARCCNIREVIEEIKCGLQEIEEGIFELIRGLEGLCIDNCEAKQIIERGVCALLEGVKLIDEGLCELLHGNGCEAIEILFEGIRLVEEGLCEVIRGLECLRKI